MSSPATLPLSNIVDVVIFVSPQSPPLPTFNQGLIIGPSTHIPSVGGISPRIRQYQTLAQMASDGFLTSDPEYIAAGLYFGQSPAPQLLWIGRQDLTAITGLAINVAGANYVVGDVVGITQGGGTFGTAKVTTVNAGAVTGLQLLTGGTGYSAAAGLATTGGTGAGLTVNITTVGETALMAVQACRTASLQWWACMVTDAAKADHEAIAAFIQTATPNSFYFFTTADADALAGTVGNVFSVLKAANYSRTLGLYSTSQSGTFPNNAYACAAVMGVSMGLNTGLANSAFTLKFKVLTGVATEPLTPTSIGIIEGNNGNLYLSYGNTYSVFEQGVVSNAQFFDEIINLDMLGSAIAFGIMNLLVGSPKVPQTDAGQTQLIGAATDACEAAYVRGFIGGGVWNGVQILKLTSGASLPKGYSVQSPPYSTQSTANRQARQSMPIYVAIIESGAVHSVLIGVYVQR